MKIHVVSESSRYKGNGVYTAFVTHVELLRRGSEVEIVVNREGRGDLLHAHTWTPKFFLMGIGYKGRRIHTVHVIPESIIGSVPMCHFFMPFAKWYFRQVYSYADVCIAISPHVEEAIREVGAHTEIVRIPNPIPSETWYASAERKLQGRTWLGLDEDAFVVLGVGQLQARKGVEEFIEMARNVPEASFVWVGGRPLKMMTEGIARIDRQMEHAPSNLRFVGLVDLENMPLVYNAADVMLFPSHQENCPLAPIEAAACGLPVVFRDLPEYRQLYEHDYLSASDTEGFLLILRKLMQDEMFYADALTLSSNLILQFDKNVIRSKWIHLYERVLEQHTVGLHHRHVRA